MKLRNGSVLTVLTLAAFFSMSWFASQLNMKGGEDEVTAYQQELQELSNRMRQMEEENLKYSVQLKLVLDKIKHTVAEEKKAMNNTPKNLSKFSGKTHDAMKMQALNLTRKDYIQQPNIFYYLPHLMSNEDSLQPKVMIGQGKTGVLMVMGIPTVKREPQTYLFDTLNSLIYELSPEERKNCVIVVLIAEVEESYVNKLAENLQNTYSYEIQAGLLEIISPSANFYPDLSNLRETFGDSQQRVKWRTKQNLDYSFLMMYAQAKGAFYLQLEDDIIATPNYLQTMINFAQQQPSDDWMTLEFSQLGFIGKLFKSPDLTLIIEFIIMFYKDKPIDWLLDHLLWVKVCNPEKDAHVGTHSSLAGKLQPLKDKDFKKEPLHKGHSNPTAELTSSLKIYQHHSLDKAYQGDDFFWAFTPVAGDFIKFRFFQPLKVERYIFRSGNVEHPGDKLFNTTVEVLPVDKSAFEKKILHNNMTKYPKYKETEDGYYRIGTFRNGIAEGEVDASIGTIEAIRLSILSESPVWILLSEIFIKPAA
ncbi:alpha-1,3-mannosyl-glycoprotein 4-beta-N-acetylglucosaminyltransferase B-like isoform X3 [Mustelus asterias]